MGHSYKRRGPRILFGGKPYRGPDGLSKKQLTTLSMLGYGLSVGEIAAAEKVSSKSIECRRTQITHKLKLEPYNIADIVRTAIAFRLTTL